MKTLILAAAAAAATLIAGAASAQPYGYARNVYDHPAYSNGAYSYGGYDNARYADRDRDGIPDRWDRYDNRRARWEHRHDWRYERYARERYERDHRW